jgi:hypothetical protein
MNYSSDTSAQPVIHSHGKLYKISGRHYERMLRDLQCGTALKSSTKHFNTSIRLNKKSFESSLGFLIVNLVRRFKEIEKEVSLGLIILNGRQNINLNHFMKACDKNIFQRLLRLLCQRCSASWQCFCPSLSRFLYRLRKRSFSMLSLHQHCASLLQRQGT